MFRTVRWLSLLVVLSSLVSLALGPAAAVDTTTYRLPLPNGTASVEVVLPPYTVDRDTRPDAFGRFVAGTLAGSGITFSLNIVGGLGRPSVDQCALSRLRELMARRLVKRQQDSAIERTPEKAVFAYLSETEGQPWHHEWAFLASDEACVEIHLSKSDPNTDDQETFAMILKSMALRTSAASGK